METETETETCGILANDWFITGVCSPWSSECVRPRGHFGPHMIRREDGTFIAYEMDIFCTCESCQSENPDDWCEVYREVSPKEVELLRSTLEEGITLVSLTRT